MRREMVMKKVVAMSDNHGDEGYIYQVLEYESDADIFVHCGDSESYDQELLRKFFAVRGNNDWGLNLKEHLILQVAGHRIYVCHGHKAGYFNRQITLVSLAHENNCDIVLSGHTHIACHEIYEGVHLVNPGSTRLPRGYNGPSYCVLYLDDEKVDVVFKSMDDGQVMNLEG